MTPVISTPIILDKQPAVLDKQPTKSHKQRYSYLTYRCISTLIEHSPRLLNLAVAKVSGLIMYLSRPSQHRVVRNNMIAVVGSKSSCDGLGGKLILELTVLRAYLSYARYWVESAQIRSDDTATINSSMSYVEGFSYITQGVLKGKGVILALPHLGNWDFGGAWFALQGYPLTTVGEILEPYELFEWFVEKRRLNGIDVLPLDSKAGKALLNVLESGGVIALVCDRDLVGNGVEVSFFGKKTTVPAGPAVLALRTGAALIPVAVYTGTSTHHYATIRAPLEVCRTGSFRLDVTRLTQTLVHELEYLIYKEPHQWHAFQEIWDGSETKAVEDSNGTKR
ncbi:MAG: phosphatidylinositol mannoside acyltransferase [Actinobacteria bacterium]|nr:phosphatidylinositol mannoside acyltransferase [Actinomycetota bacterium]MCL6105524.1 phosphatidylinositol mannoside acyltransferase [Actinomycetota bacterium]